MPLKPKCSVQRPPDCCRLVAGEIREGDNANAYDDGDPATLDNSWLDAQEVAHRRFLESKQRVVPPGGRPAGVNQTHQHSTAPSLEKEKQPD